MAKQLVKSGAVAQPIGPYSLAVRSGNLVFVSGTVGWRPDGSVSSDIREQCRQMYENVRQVLTSAGSSLEDVVTTTTYLVNTSDYRALNEVRAQYFKKDPPASAVVVVKELVRPDLLVEVEAVAEVGTKRVGGVRSPRRPARKARSGRRR
jgi:2-iminobutanoate/2-iminopropanoate deaminase